MEFSFPNTSNDHEIGLRWIGSAESEHASIASFARHTLQLLSLNAPADLLIASQTAAIDEVRHTEASYGVANAVLKTNIKPDVLDGKELPSVISDLFSFLVLIKGPLQTLLNAHKGISWIDEMLHNITPITYENIFEILNIGYE